MNRVILAVTVMGLLVLSVFFFGKREGVENASYQGSFMEDVRLVNKGTGKDKWTLKAQKVELPQEGSASRLSHVAITLPEHEMDVTSEEGTFDLESKDLTLTGNIEARTDDYLLTTDTIHLDSETGEITSKDKVILKGNSFMIEGNGFHTSGGSRVTFKDNVKATFF